MPTNPSPKWDEVPVFGFYDRGDGTLDPGRLELEMPERVIRGGQVIYAGGAKRVAVVGDRAAEPIARARVRTAYRAAAQTRAQADATAAGEPFDPVTWAAEWEAEVWEPMEAMGVFLSFPASDDPDVEGTVKVKVVERLESGRGRTYFLEPLLAHLTNDPPGINLATIAVPPGSPTNPAPVYAKGIAGGVAALDAEGYVVNADGSRPAGGGGGAPGDAVIRLDDDGVPYFTTTA